VLVGFARAVGDAALVATVHDVAVMPELQRLGLGRQLLARLLRQVGATAWSSRGVGMPVVLSRRLGCAVGAAVPLLRPRPAAEHAWHHRRGPAGTRKQPGLLLGLQVGGRYAVRSTTQLPCLPSRQYPCLPHPVPTPIPGTALDGTARAAPR
jgi:hypothetical protein